MTRITTLALAVVFTVAITDLALRGAELTNLTALAALALVSIVATAALGGARRLAYVAYQRGYRQANRQS